jgi:hypothetical protein
LENPIAVILPEEITVVDVMISSKDDGFGKQILEPLKPIKHAKLLQLGVFGFGSDEVAGSHCPSFNPSIN